MTIAALVKKCRFCPASVTYATGGKSKFCRGGFDAWCRECKRLYYRKYYARNVGKALASAKRYYTALRAEFLSVYGGKCECCGETEPKFLTMEHRHGTGWKDRREIGNTYNILASLKRRGWPKEDIGILCFNCNCAKAFYKKCPHNKE